MSDDPLTPPPLYTLPFIQTTLEKDSFSFKGGGYSPKGFNEYN